MTYRCTKCGVRTFSKVEPGVAPGYAFARCLKHGRILHKSDEVVREPRPAARHTDPQTSHDAALSVTNVAGTRRLVLDILEREPLTDEEIFRLALELHPMVTPSGLRTRRSELVRMGLVEDSGERRLLDTHRRGIVWRLRQTAVTNTA